MPFSLPGIPALSCGHTPAAFQGFAPGTPLNTAGGMRGSFPFWLLRFPPAFAGFPARSVLQAASLHSQLADIIEIYADVLDCVSRPFLVALMHFNPADKLVENGGGKLSKGGMAFRQLQKLLRPSSRVLISG